MKYLRSKPAMALATAAAISLTATPVMARGWHKNYDRGHHRGHHNRGLDAGDVFAGLLILGGIAAVASAASKSKQDKEDREYRQPEQAYPGSRPPSDDDYRNWRDGRDRYGEDRNEREGRPYGGSSYANGMDAAVDSCVKDVERDSRSVDLVDNVNRDGQGWRIEGKLRGGSVFSCSADVDGRILSLNVDGRGAN